MFLSTALVIFIQMFAYFSITFFIYKAFGLSGYNLFEIVALQSFLYLTVSFVPLPGASVASEGGFYLFFAQVFPAELKFCPDDSLAVLYLLCQHHFRRCVCVGRFAHQCLPYRQTCASGSKGINKT